MTPSLAPTTPRKSKRGRRSREPIGFWKETREQYVNRFWSSSSVRKPALHFQPEFTQEKVLLVPTGLKRKWCKIDSISHFHSDMVTLRYTANGKIYSSKQIFGPNNLPLPDSDTTRTPAFLPKYLTLRMICSGAVNCHYLFFPAHKGRILLHVVDPGGKQQYRVGRFWYSWLLI